MKSARCIKGYKNFISGNIYKYDVDGYVINAYMTSSNVQYFGSAHFFNLFDDITTERRKKLEKLK